MTRAWIGMIAILAFTSHADADPTTTSVVVRADDGTILKGTYASPGKPGPGVLLFHMCNSKRQAWDNLLPKLTAKGMHVLAIDYRGYGESGGKPQAQLTNDERTKLQREVVPKDLDSVFAFFVAQPGVDRSRLGAGGGSCGVNNSIQLARRHPEVTTLVLLAGGTDDEGTSFLERASWIPIFAVAAHDDGGAVASTRWVMQFSSNPNNTFKDYPNGGHGTELFPIHKDLEPAIASWFERHLITKPVKPTPGAAPRPGPSAQLAAKLRAPGAVAALTAQVRTGKKVDLPPEAIINVMGYSRLQANRVKEAIELFTLNVEAHPGSANVYDSLSDAYVAAKDPANAVLYAKKALDALPGDKSLNAEVAKQIRESCEAKIKANAKP